MIFFCRVRKCPTTPRPEAIKQLYFSGKNLENAQPQKRHDQKNDASRKCPAVTCSPGKKHIHGVVEHRLCGLEVLAEKRNCYVEVSSLPLLQLPPLSRGVGCRFLARVQKEVLLPCVDELNVEAKRDQIQRDTLFFDFWAISLCLMFEVTFVGFSLVLASVKHSYMNTKSQSLETIRNVLSWKETGNAC